MVGYGLFALPPAGETDGRPISPNNAERTLKFTSERGER